MRQNLSDPVWSWLEAYDSAQMFLELWHWSSCVGWQGCNAVIMDAQLAPKSVRKQTCHERFTCAVCLARVTSGCVELDIAVFAKGVQELLCLFGGVILCEGIGMPTYVEASKDDFGD
jgi:hypothetical protein